MRPSIIQDRVTRCTCVRIRSFVTRYSKTLNFVGCDERMRRHTPCLVQKSGDIEDNPLIRPVGHLLPRFQGRRDSREAAISAHQRLSVNLAHDTRTLPLKRRGYTLVEMLIASVLVAALMSVVWGMMSMYNSYLTAGQAQATEQQLIRSLLQMIESDLQSVSAPDTNPRVVPSPGITSESSTLSAEPPALLVDPLAVDPLSTGTEPALSEPSVFAGPASGETIAIPGQVSLIGNSSSMKLSIEQPKKELPPVLNSNPMTSDTSLAAGDAGVPAASTTPEPMASPEDTISVEGVAPKVSEYQTIIWQFQAPGMIAGNQALQAGLYRIQTESLTLQTALSQQDSPREDSVAESDESVDRRTLETLLFPPANTQAESGGATPASDGPVQNVPKFDLIPEVVSCRFEYFSGSSWASTWNSAQQHSLPLAIRVRMQLVTAADLEKLKQIFGDSTSQDSPLDEAIDDSLSTTSPSAVSPPATTEDPTTDPLATIQTRQVERIILLQHVSGHMPEPGTGSDASEPEAAL